MDSSLKGKGKMENTILSLISSYKNIISTLQDVIALNEITAHEENIILIDKEREKLENKLQGMLAKNCSLRRKDFQNMMKRIVCDIEKRKEKTQQKQKQIREMLEDYFGEQKKLATFLKEKLTQFAQGKSNEDSLKTILADIKTLHDSRGKKVFSGLQDFKLHLELFRKDQEKVNRRLQRLIDRGKSLRTEDLRRLESTKAHEQRRAERRILREDVERLLSHFKQERQR
jgi:hypothetical protein